MLVRGIDDMLINLVGDDVAVVSYHDISYLLQFLASKYLAAGVRRVAQHQRLDSLSESILNEVGIECICRRMMESVKPAVRVDSGLISSCIQS